MSGTSVHTVVRDGFPPVKATYQQIRQIEDLVLGEGTSDVNVLRKAVAVLGSQIRHDWANSERYFAAPAMEAGYQFLLQKKQGWFGPKIPASINSGEELTPVIAMLLSYEPMTYPDLVMALPHVPASWIWEWLNKEMKARKTDLRKFLMGGVFHYRMVD